MADSKQLSARTTIRSSYTTDSNWPVLILGTGLAALGVARCLGAAGIRTYCASGVPGILKHSRFCNPLPRPETFETGNLESHLRKLELTHAVLLPCSDDAALKVSALPEQLKRQFPTVGPASESLNKLLDKWQFSLQLSQLNIPAPETGLVNEQSLSSLPDHVFKNAFLKPRDSQAFHARFGMKGFRVTSRAEALERYECLGAEPDQLLLQEYIPGPASSHFFIDGYRSKDETNTIYFVRRRLRMYPLDFGNSTALRSESPEGFEEQISSLQRLISAVNFHGLFSAEFKIDAGDGRAKLIEINARGWWFIDFSYLCGVNLPQMFYCDALDLPFTPVSNYDTGRELVHTYYDKYACASMIRKGNLSVWQWGSSWLRSSKALFRWNDPLPTLFDILGRAKQKLTGKGK